MRIKAISLWEPWASLMAIGAKELETRSWHTKYRGPLAIHAAKRWRDDQAEYFFREPYASVLAEAGIMGVDDLHLGCIVGIGMLAGCYAAEKVRKRLEVKMRVNELAFGNYGYGRWAWHVQGMVRLKKPVPVKGAQGLWYWDVPAAVSVRGCWKVDDE